MTAGKGKRPRDPVQLAKQVFYIAVGEAEDPVRESKRMANRKGRSGGLTVPDAVPPTLIIGTNQSA